LKTLSLREMSLQAPPSIWARAVNPSHLISKYQSGWSNGSVLRLSGIGWKRDDITEFIIIDPGGSRLWYAARFRVFELCEQNPCPIYGEWKAKYARLHCVILRTCKVSVTDIQDVEHSVEVTAGTLYEAVATALAALQQDNWVGEIGQGLTTVTVIVQQPPVRHEVKMKDFLSWLGRQGGSPAEIIGHHDRWQNQDRYRQRSVYRAVPCPRNPAPMLQYLCHDRAPLSNHPIPAAKNIKRFSDPFFKAPRSCHAV